MTEQIQILQRHLECFSRDIKLLCIAFKVFSMYLGGNRGWVELAFPCLICLKINLRIENDRIIIAEGTTAFKKGQIKHTLFYGDC